MNKISEVRQALGENSNSLSILSTSNNVNKWSFYKPIQFNKITALTDEEINSKNCGFYNFVFNTPFDLIHNIGEVWKYEKPSSYFRLSDFKYYNHNAERWYILQELNNNNNFVRLDLTTDISLFTSFQELKNQDLDFGFLISTTLDNTTVSGYYYKQCNILDLDGNYHIDASNLPIGTYQVIPVLTSDIRYNSGTLTAINRNSDFVGSWYAFPSQPIAIQVADIPPITKKLQLSVANSYYALGVDQTGEFIENIEFDLQVSLDSGNLYYSIELWFKNAYDGNKVKDIKVGEVSGNITGGSVNTHNIKYSDRIHYLAGDYDVKFPLTAKITVNGEIEERTITILK